MRGGFLRLDVVHAEAPFRFSNLERPIDSTLREERRSALGGHRPEIREGLGGDHCAHTRIVGRFLQSHGGAERGADQYDRTRAERIDHMMEIPLFEETVGARIPLRLAVCAAVVGDDVESAREKALDDAGGTAAVVGDAVEINDRPARGTRG